MLGKLCRETIVTWSLFCHGRGNQLLKVIHRIHTLKLMKFMFKCCTESVLMTFAAVLRFLGFICVIHLSGKSQFSGLLREWNLKWNTLEQIKWLMIMFNKHSTIIQMLRLLLSRAQTAKISSTDLFYPRDQVCKWLIGLQSSKERESFGDTKTVKRYHVYTDTRLRYIFSYGWFCLR